MVNETAIVGPKLDRPDVAPALAIERRDVDCGDIEGRDIEGDHKVAKNVVDDLCIHGIGLRQGDHEIRLSELPAGRELGQRRQILITTWGALAHPRSNHPPLDRTEATCVLELTIAGLRLPGGHVAALGNDLYLLGTPSHVGIAEQREGCDLAGSVASNAVGEHDRRDVAVEGERTERGNYWSRLSERKTLLVCGR